MDYHTKPFRSTPVSIEVVTLVGVWVEVFLYGIYTYLFFESLYIMLKKRKTRTSSGKIFLSVVLTMYLVATANIAFNLHRTTQAFIYLGDSAGRIDYLLDVRRWENFGPTVTFWFMTWLGDGLLIYRCFVIWGQSHVVIILPSLLLIYSIALNAVIMFWTMRSFTVSFAGLKIWMNTVYPTTFAQSILTTGLIVFKILRQHRGSTAAGVRNAGSRLRLIHVVRILIESAMLYTFQLFIMIILNHGRFKAQFIVQCALVPTIGIVFNLIAVRIHRAGSATLQGISTDVLCGTSRLTDDRSSAQTEIDHSSSHQVDEEAPQARLEPTGVLACAGAEGSRHHRNQSV